MTSSLKVRYCSLFRRKACDGLAKHLRCFYTPNVSDAPLTLVRGAHHLPYAGHQYAAHNLPYMPAHYKCLAHVSDTHRMPYASDILDNKLVAP